MHIIAVKREVLDAHPWVGRNLYNAFLESKKRSLERLLDPAVSRYPLPWLPTYGRKMRDMFGGDPFPFGIEENRPTLETFLRYTYEQGIAHRHAKPEEIFQKGIMASVVVWGFPLPRLRAASGGGGADVVHVGQPFARSALMPHAGDGGEHERDHDVGVGERDAEESRRQVAAHDAWSCPSGRAGPPAPPKLVMSPVQSVRARPEFPLDARVVDRDPGSDQHHDRQQPEPADHHGTRRVARDDERDDQRQRNADVVDLALQEAEPTGLDAEHVLEEIGAQNRGDAACRHDERGGDGGMRTTHADRRRGHGSTLAAPPPHSVCGAAVDPGRIHEDARPGPRGGPTGPDR